MSQDREAPPCARCGAELYEKFWGNGGWAITEKATGQTHGETACIARLLATIAAQAETIRRMTDALRQLRPTNDAHSTATYCHRRAGSTVVPCCDTQRRRLIIDAALNGQRRGGRPSDDGTR